MTTKKAKTKVAAKRKRREPAKRRASAKRTEPAMQYRNKATEQQKHTVPGPEAAENPGWKWKLSVGPMETVSIAEDAPLCQMVVQNLGPAIVEIRCENGEPVVLMPGKLCLMSAYGRITVESVEENWATVELDFLPRTRESWY
jgi:hypothetical protein